ncbi:MAG: glycosyl hydrolase family 2, partial [bacterium]|nr:glycosyl hydrolase family 2 [bacterium]
TNDPSRLISPVASQSRLKTRNDNGTLDHAGKPVESIPAWTAPQLTRGNMDHTTGYGAAWATLRKFPHPPSWQGEEGWRGQDYRVDFLNSGKRAYFDFESEESAAQPNWTLRKGKPSYQQKSYELDYDQGSIGRRLRVDEWEESQAWQAFSGYEAYRKKRWLDYDGLAWCNLRGGPNTATYQKPLVDYWGHAKMAFYAVRMAFQKALAGSRNVDLAYGPADEIPIVIMNLGAARNVDLTVTVRDPAGEEIHRKLYRNIHLPAGRTTVNLPAYKPVVPVDGFYAVNYSLTHAATP